MLVYDETRNLVADMYLRNRDRINEGDELEFEHHLVSIEDLIRTVVQDLTPIMTPILERRQMKQAAGAVVPSPLANRQVLYRNIENDTSQPVAQGHSQDRPRHVNNPRPSPKTPFQRRPTPSVNYSAHQTPRPQIQYPPSMQSRNSRLPRQSPPEHLSAELTPPSPIRPPPPPPPQFRPPSLVPPPQPPQIPPARRMPTVPRPPPPAPPPPALRVQNAPRPQSALTPQTPPIAARTPVPRVQNAPRPQPELTPQTLPISARTPAPRMQHASRPQPALTPPVPVTAPAPAIPQSMQSFRLDNQLKAHVPSSRRPFQPPKFSLPPKPPVHEHQLKVISPPPAPPRSPSPENTFPAPSQIISASVLPRKRTAAALISDDSLFKSPRPATRPRTKNSNPTTAGRKKPLSLPSHLAEDVDVDAHMHGDGNELVINDDGKNDDYNEKKMEKDRETIFQPSTLKLASAAQKRNKLLCSRASSARPSPPTVAPAPEGPKQRTHTKSGDKSARKKSVAAEDADLADDIPLLPPHGRKRPVMKQKEKEKPARRPPVVREPSGFSGRSESARRVEEGDVNEGEASLDVGSWSRDGFDLFEWRPPGMEGAYTT
ncbi:hypothetical protein RUND412_001278 [Rhizina undulata]